MSSVDLLIETQMQKVYHMHSTYSGGNCCCIMGDSEVMCGRVVTQTNMRFI